MSHGEHLRDVGPVVRCSVDAAVGDLPKLRPILGEVGVRQLGTSRSQKIKMARVVSPYRLWGSRITWHILNDLGIDLALVSSG
jgi:hypothetical protein